MKNSQFIRGVLDDAHRNFVYAMSNPAEFAQLNALTSIAASLVVIGELLLKMDERAENELERIDFRNDHPELMGRR